MSSVLLRAALFVLLGAGIANAQPPIGILGIPQEIVPIEKRLEGAREVTVEGVVFRTGTLNGRPVVVGRSGTGKVYAAIATTLLIAHFKPAAVFFSGTAGAVDPSIDLGDVVVATAVAQHDFGQQAPDGLRRRGPRNPVTLELEPVLLQSPDTLLAAAREVVPTVKLPRLALGAINRPVRIAEGVIVTGDVFVADPVQRDELRKSLNAAAVEMEGAAFVQTCRQFVVPCLVVRGITDRADGAAMESYASLRTQASENAAAVVAAVIARLARAR